MSLTIVVVTVKLLNSLAFHEGNNTKYFKSELFQRMQTDQLSGSLICTDPYFSPLFITFFSLILLAHKDQFL